MSERERERIRTLEKQLVLLLEEITILERWRDECNGDPLVLAKDMREDVHEIGMRMSSSLSIDVCNVVLFSKKKDYMNMSMKLYSIKIDGEQL